MDALIESVARSIYSDDPENWDEALRIVNGTFGGEGFMDKYPDTKANYKADMDEARDKARRAIETTLVASGAMNFSRRLESRDKLIETLEAENENLRKAYDEARQETMKWIRSDGT